MGLETGTKVTDLVTTNPIATDPRSEGDDHLRLLKVVLAGDVMSASKAVTDTAKATPVDGDLLGLVDSAASNVRKSLSWANLKTTLASTFAALAGSASQAFSASTLSAATGIAVGGATPGTGGIAFPATAVAVADANTLDDYEEGTWTPVVTATTGAYTTVTSESGVYTKIGKQVTVQGYFVVSDKGTGSDAAIINGLPFTKDANRYEGCGGSQSTGAIYSCYGAPGNTTAYLYTATGGDPITAGQGRFICLTYFI